MSSPRMSHDEAQAQLVFSALMWSLSYPGQPQRLPATDLGAFVVVGQALLDLETTCYSDDAALAEELARTGARRREPDAALYQFYPRLADAALARLAAAPAGSYAYPDESATLVLGCARGAGRLLRLSGPGIARPVDVCVGGLPDAFWELRARACRYPLGWDLFLIAGDELIGLPRSTTVEVR